MSTQATGARELNLDYNRAQQLHRWRMSGAVTPSIRDARGSGTRVEWSDSDLARLRCLFEVRDRFHANDLVLPLAVAADIWDSLVLNGSWSLCFEASLAP